MPVSRAQRQWIEIAEVTDTGQPESETATPNAVIASLTVAETGRLAELERVVARGLGAFVEVGQALREIRDRKLYRQQHGTFEDYCQERWGLSRIHGHRMIEAAGVVNDLLPIGNKMPTCEAQARELVPLSTEQRREVWALVTAAGCPEPTAKRIREVIREQRQRRHDAWLRTIVSGLADRCAAEPLGSPLNPHTSELDPIYEPPSPEDWGLDPNYDFEGEDDSGFEGGSEADQEDVEADEDDDVPDPRLFRRGNEKVGERLFRRGNRKVGDKPLLWNLPVFDTCPGRTMSCVENCYANNDNSRRPTVKRRHASNLRAAEADNFCERAIVELRRRRPTEVRIHSAGDFHTPEYVRKWLSITAALPNITFWFYTRSWRVPSILHELVRLASLSNVRAWFSADRDSGLPMTVPNVRACWLQIEDEEPPEPEPGQMPIELVFRTRREGRESTTRIGLALLCPTYTGLPTAADQTCETCRFCFR